MSEGAPLPPPMSTPAATDELLRRVGRCLMMFQQVEHALKYLMTHSRFEAPASSFAERFAEHAERINKRTMGDLAGRLAETVLSQDQPDTLPEEIEEIWTGFRFTVETDAELAARHEAELKELVDRRNELVHHFLPRWHAAMAGEMQAALAWLDAQFAAAKAVHTRLYGWAEILKNSRLEYFEFMASEEGQRQLELGYLRSCRLVRMLGEISMATPRADGWTLLSTAGHLIKRDAPEELADMSRHLGYSKLKPLLQETGMFDVAEEPISGGSTRTIYRLKDGWRLDRAPEATAAVQVPLASNG